MSDGVHAMLFSRDTDADAALLRDALGLSCASAGGGWLVVALASGQSGLDPAGEDDRHQLYLGCADLEPALAALRGHGAAFTQRLLPDGVRAASIALPGGASILLRQA